MGSILLTQNPILIKSLTSRVLPLLPETADRTGKDKMSKIPYRFALFGAGRMGSVHFRDLLLSSRAEVTWIVEEDLSRAQDLVDRYQQEKNTHIWHIERMEDVLSDDR